VRLVKPAGLDTAGEAGLLRLIASLTAFGPIGG